MRNSNNRIADNLKKIDFLHQLRRQLQQPTGLSPHQHLPLTTWLAQDLSQQHHDLMIWHTSLHDLETSITLIFNILRHQNKQQQCQTKRGFFQHALSSQSQCDLLRIIPQHDSPVYPKISVGHHGLSLHFLIPDYHHQGNTSPIKDEIEFTLQCCKIL